MRTNRGYIWILAFCCFFQNCYFEPEDEQSPKLEIFFYTPGSDDAIDDSVFYADGTVMANIKVKVSPAIRPIENRKISLSTTLGSFLVDGEFKKSFELVLNSDGEGEVWYAAPLAPGDAYLKLSSINSIVTATKKMTFEPALPEMVEIETPFRILKDSSNTVVSVRMKRTSGRVSVGLYPDFKLVSFENDDEEVKNSTFFKISPSDSSGQSSCTLVLEKPNPGKYLIQVSFKGLDDIRWTHQIEVTN